MDKYEFKCAATDSKKLMDYLEKKARNHNNYKIYTEYSRVKNILSKKALYLNDGNKWNDKVDGYSFNSDVNKKNFGCCFCFSKLENIAMWMLYGGLNNCGVMISFSKSDIKNILENKGTIELGCFSDQCFHTIKSINKEQYEIKIIDILYYNFDKSVIKLKHADKTAELDNSEHNREQLDDLKFCKKTAHWRYENECRLIISIDKELVDSSEITTVKLPIEDTVDLCTIEKSIIRSPNWKGVFTYEQSELTGKVDWDLRKNCNRFSEDKCL